MLSAASAPECCEGSGSECACDLRPDGDGAERRARQAGSMDLLLQETSMANRYSMNGREWVNQYALINASVCALVPVGARRPDRCSGTPPHAPPRTVGGPNCTGQPLRGVGMGWDAAGLRGRHCSGCRTALHCTVRRYGILEKIGPRRLSPPLRDLQRRPCAPLRDRLCSRDRRRRAG